MASRFVKRFPSHFRDELYKARALHQLGAATRFFVAPAVESCDEGRATITFARLEALRSLRDYYLDYVCGSNPDRVVLEIFGRVGRVLAALHRDLVLPERHQWVPSKPFRRLLDARLGASGVVALATGPQAFLHGDFGFGNVHVATASRGSHIVLLDASPNQYTTFHPFAYGPVYLDLAALLACLHGLVPLRRYVRIRWGRVPRTVAAVTEGYSAESGIELDRSLTDAVTYAVAGTYLGRRFRSRLLGEAAAALLFARWSLRDDSHFGGRSR